MGGYVLRDPHLLKGENGFFFKRQRCVGEMIDPAEEGKFKDKAGRSWNFCGAGSGQ
jgi:hypothetical protein